ncbi:hypothetical protein [Aeromicrobium sp. CTD01-1L150]|uniref:hypothetical protein n=1 Tax=Aeromicrobium sp. CTD01-1L150 TaxID=3341830 RepID=UPI0035C04E6A
MIKPYDTYLVSQHIREGLPALQTTAELVHEDERGTAAVVSAAHDASLGLDPHIPADDRLEAVGLDTVGHAISLMLVAAVT